MLLCGSEFRSREYKKIGLSLGRLALAWSGVEVWLASEGRLDGRIVRGSIARGVVRQACPGSVCFCAAELVWPRMVWWIWPLLVVLEGWLGSASAVWAAWPGPVCVLLADLVSSHLRADVNDK
jgi:hypothetical protein